MFILVICIRVQEHIQTMVQMLCVIKEILNGWQVKYMLQDLINREQEDWLRKLIIFVFTRTTVGLPFQLDVSDTFSPIKCLAISVHRYTGK